MDQLRRRLPHVWAESKRLFVTWHLYGALPAAKQTECGTSLCLDGPISRLRPWWTALLETTTHRATGSDSIHYGAQHLQYYELEAFVVMANHVHLLVLPRVSPSRFLQTLKGYTAREANRLLGRTGQPFWQAESYDHSGRDDRESDRIKGYIENIENNPVKAGLVANAEDYLWSSAARKAEMNLGSAGSTACATKLSEQYCSLHASNHRRQDRRS